MHGTPMLDGLSGLMTRFNAALTTGDIGGISDIFATPVFLTTPAGGVVFETHDDVRQMLEQIFQYYQPKGFQRFEKRDLEVRRLTKSSALVHSVLRTIGVANEVIAVGDYTFLLRKSGDDWKIISLITDGPVLQRIASAYPQDSWKV
jgi:ketosteroid isomerase-like protein